MQSPFGKSRLSGRRPVPVGDDCSLLSPYTLPLGLCLVMMLWFSDKLRLTKPIGEVCGYKNQAGLTDGLDLSIEGVREVQTRLRPSD